MSEAARAILELATRDWSELTEDDRAALSEWLRGAQPVDLYLLLHDARQRWRRPRRSSSQTMAAIAETAAPEDNEA